MTFKDHFSGHSAQYADARPNYPSALFAQIAAQAPSRRQCWDAGCGNGQASLGWAEVFDAVFATDPSAAQITQATAHPRIRYAVERAEACSLGDASVDLVGIAQALHWCDVDAFHREARRVLRPGGLIVEFGYGECAVDAAVDAVYRRLYDELTAPYWPPERRHVERRYADLAFPFEPVDVGVMPPMQQRWTLAQYATYLDSWSASARYRAAQGHSPLDVVADDLVRAWGDPEHTRTVTWALFVRVGRA